MNLDQCRISAASDGPRDLAFTRLPSGLLDDTSQRRIESPGEPFCMGYTALETGQDYDFTCQPIAIGQNYTGLCH